MHIFGKLCFPSLVACFSRLQDITLIDGLIITSGVALPPETYYLGSQLGNDVEACADLCANQPLCKGFTIFTPPSPLAPTTEVTTTGNFTTPILCNDNTTMYSANTTDNETTTGTPCPTIPSVTEEPATPVPTQPTAWLGECYGIGYYTTYTETIFSHSQYEAVSGLLRVCRGKCSVSGTL